MFFFFQFTGNTVFVQCDNKVQRDHLVSGVKGMAPIPKEPDSKIFFTKMPQKMPF